MSQKHVKYIFWLCAENYYRKVYDNRKITSVKLKHELCESLMDKVQYFNIMALWIINIFKYMNFMIDLHIKFNIIDHAFEGITN